MSNCIVVALVEVELLSDTQNEIGYGIKRLTRRYLLINFL